MEDMSLEDLIQIHCRRQEVRKVMKMNAEMKKVMVEVRRRHMVRLYGNLCVICLVRGMWG